MSKKVLPNPNLTTWGAIRAATSLWAVFLFLGWLFKFIWEPGRYGGFHSDPPSFPPLTIKELLLGSGFFPLSLWSLWAWQPKRKHARWHRWLASLTGAIYLSVLIMLGGVKSWNVLLDHPWNWMVNSTLFMLLIISWILPALSYSWAKKIAHAQDVLGLRMLSYGGVGSLMVLAGILGANLGMRLFGSGKLRLAALIMAFGWPLVAVFFLLNITLNVSVPTVPGRRRRKNECVDGVGRHPWRLDWDVALAQAKPKAIGDKNVQETLQQNRTRLPD